MTDPSVVRLDLTRIPDHIDIHQLDIVMSMLTHRLRLLINLFIALLFTLPATSDTLAAAKSPSKPPVKAKRPVSAKPKPKTVKPAVGPKKQAKAPAQKISAKSGMPGAAHKASAATSKQGRIATPRHTRPVPQLQSGQPQAASEERGETRTAQMACEFNGKIYLLADCNENKLGHMPTLASK